MSRDLDYFVILRQRRDTISPPSLVIIWVESVMIAFLPRATAATTTTVLTGITWTVDNNPSTKRWTLHACHTDTAPPASDHLLRRYTQLGICAARAVLRDEGPASRLKRLASPAPPAPNNPPAPPSPIHMNRLSKPDPLVLAMGLRCGYEEAKTPSPTRMRHSTSSADEQRYLPKTTATSDSTKLLLHIPGHRTLSPPRLFIEDSTRARLRTCATVLGARTTGSHALPRC